MWISEALSHFVRKDAFFAGAMRMLKPGVAASTTHLATHVVCISMLFTVGGKLVLADWFRADHISKKHADGVIAAIEKGMLCTWHAAPKRFVANTLRSAVPRLDAMSDYLRLMHGAGLRLLWLQDVSKETARTWDICLDVVANPVWARSIKVAWMTFATCVSRAGPVEARVHDGTRVRQLPEDVQVHG